ncbi:REPEAT-CONTAINING PROTEIN putative-RELATED [Salix viminalis]|uniref:REPEAT-CONTAINING PROTEIN putative-RELATED n=1 Tax=Salix viminalis TaxID=40686 RepID=A0A9Q0NVF5_SALVM|nr:REPEAT-CONTAINING PROTEIN putative-RELATED [Salix viminalis]
MHKLINLMMQFLLYTKMIGCDVIPDNYTYACLIRACCESFYFDGLRIVHGSVIISGLGLDPVTCSALVTGYSKMGLVGEAGKVFCGVFKPDLVLWNAMISGCGYCGFGDKGLLFFNEMRDNGSIKPDGYTFVALISGLANSSSLDLGQGIHGLCLKSGFDCNDHVGSSLVSMYSRFSYINLAYGVFRSLCQPDLVTWSALITGFSQAGEYDKALLFYRNLNLTGLGLHGLAPQAFDMFTEVLEKGLKPDESTFSALLCACCHAGLIEDGREIFRRMKEEFWIQARTEHYVHIVKLLGMAGELDEAYNFILSLKQPVDSGIWGALLSCCDAHGDSELAEIVAQQLFDGEPRKGAYRVMLSNIYAGDGKWVDVEKMRDYITTAGAEKMPGLSRIGSY